MAKAQQAEALAFDRGEWEYLTYAPGQVCAACKCEVGPLEPVRRGSVGRAPGASAVVYRHPTCPGAGGAAA
ncbi:hypothetical protein ACIQWR_01905 [Streptomyces sp. NPDC098789]|uniref:hypothetical protein n=1 Tax=Streptomyces sp. NPDC098789 TaxID=3366098 RepID=UPI0038007E44